MRAMILRQRGREGAAVGDMPRPEPGPGQALVRMLAASVNRVDLYMRDSGAGITHDLPLIMGVDGVGVVEHCPPGHGLDPGDLVILYPYEVCGTCPRCLAGDQPLCHAARILGEHRHGTFADYVALPATSLVKLPPECDVEAAATLGVAWLTAWRMVFGKAPFSPGATVLVQGAGGGVAQACVALARMAGARVIVTTTGAAKLALFRDRGIEAIDYAAGPSSRQVLALTGGEGADLVIDNVGAATWDQSLRSARRGGHIVTCGATTGAAPSADLQRLFVRQLHVHGSTMGDIGEFRRLVACFAAGRITPLIDRTYPLDRAADALARAESAERLGKVVIRIA